MPSYRIKNWEKFQHYKDRNPPWIKLYRSLHDDFEFMSLPMTTQSLLIHLWIFGSENNDGKIYKTEEEIAWRLHISNEEFKQLLKPLISRKFIQTCKQRASKPLSPSSYSNTEFYRGTEKSLSSSEKNEPDDHPQISTPKGNPDLDAAEAEGEPDPKDRYNWKVLFAYWREMYGHERSKFTKEREAKLRARLREGYTLEECASAVRGLKKSRWHMGENPEGRVWDEWNLIFQSGAKLEKFRDLDTEKVNA